MDYKKTIEDLRRAARMFEDDIVAGVGSKDWIVSVCEAQNKKIYSAADAIETLQAERDSLRGELEAAVADMQHIADEINKCDWTLSKDGDKVWSLHLGRCAVCSHRLCGENDDGNDGCHFEWRGRKEQK